MSSVKDICILEEFLHALVRCSIIERYDIFSVEWSDIVAAVSKHMMWRVNMSKQEEEFSILDSFLDMLVKLSIVETESTIDEWYATEVWSEKWS